MTKIRFTLSTNKVGSKCDTTVEVDDDEWAEMSEVERESYAREIFWDYAMNMLGEWDWTEETTDAD